jgi:hypothetical protein
MGEKQVVCEIGKQNEPLIKLFFGLCPMLNFRYFLFTITIK